MAKKGPTRKRYLEAREIMRNFQNHRGGAFYYDVLGNKDGNPKRYMRVKHLTPMDAYELYALMLNYFNAEDVRIYASRDVYSNLFHQPKPNGEYPYDAVAVTLTPYWSDIKGD